MYEPKKSKSSTVLLFVSAVLCSLTFHVSAEEAIEGNEQKLLSNTRQLIFEGRRSGEGYFSSDGSMMIFQSERDPGNPFYQMFVMDLETGDTHRVSPGKGKTTCGWIHPNNKQVLFASSHEDPKAEAKQQEELDKRASGKGSRYSWSFDEQYEIYAGDINGEGLNNLTNVRGYDAEGSWSPDGKLIAFASNRQAYVDDLSEKEREILQRDQSYFMDLYIMNADGSNVRQLTNTPGYDGGPFFSPDGKRITWRRFSEDGKTAEIWTMNIDGTDQRQITRLGAMSWAPFYHPSGDYLVFTNNLQGYQNFELYIVDVEGKGEPVRVTNTEGFDGLPVFLPSGDRIAWASSRTQDRKAQLFIADWNDAEARRLLGLSKEEVSSSDKPSIVLTPPPDLTKTGVKISPADMRLHVEYLASESLEGRLTGTQGEKFAIEYAASVFKSLGLSPAGENNDWFQPFEFTSGVSLGEGNRLTVTDATGARDLRVEQQWRPVAISTVGEIDDAPVVFAGYGIVAPADNSNKVYDSYAELDVKDKWVMVLRYLPEDVTPERRQYLANYADLHYKAMLARDKGAKGLLVVSGPNAGVKEQLIKLSGGAAAGATSIAVISISDEIADRLLQTAGKALKQRQTALDGGEAGKGFILPNVRLKANINLKHEKGFGRNVLARLNAGEQAGNTVVVVGAHIDHIGRGEIESLAGDEGEGEVHYGADDNASGVAGLFEIAQYLKGLQSKGKLKLKHDVMFAAWSGEELGRLGSQHFVSTFGGGDERDSLRPEVVAYLNMDMIGRLDKKLYLQGVGSSDFWSGELERRNAPVGLPIAIQQDSYLPTDATSFYLKGVPILSAFTGSHADYNTPRDTAESVNYKGAAKIALLMGLITRSLGMSDKVPAYVEMEKPAGTTSRRNLRAYLGTIPEYAGSDVKGVKLNAVAKGGPAEAAGLKGGDVIVELAGRKIENVYDFTYALNALKVGQAVNIVVLRDGKSETFSVVPAARE